MTWHPRRNIFAIQSFYVLKKIVTQAPDAASLQGMSVALMETPNLPDPPNAPTMPALNAVPDMITVRPSRQRAAIIAAVVALVAIVAALGGVLFFHARSVNAATAQSILNAAASASLRDAAFRVSGQAGTNLISSSTFSVTFSGNGEMTTTPNRLHFLITATNSGQSGSIGGIGTLGAFEVIVDGSTLYSRSPSSNSGQWTKTAIDAAQVSTEIFPFNSKAFLDYRNLSSPQLVGTETVDGRQTQHIHATLPTNALLQQFPADQRQQISISATEDLWLAKDTSFPVRVTESLTSSAKGISIGGITLEVTAKLTMDFTSWNTGLTIPLPTSYVDQSGAQPTAVPNS